MFEGQASAHATTRERGAADAGPAYRPDDSGWGAVDLPAVWRRLRADPRRVAVLVGAFAGLGLAYGLATPRMYTATSSILIDERRVVDEDASQGGRSLAEIGMDPASIDSQVAVAGSERVASETIRRLHLEGDASLAAPTTAFGRLSPVLSGIAGLFASRPAPRPGVIPPAILEGFMRRVQVKRQQQTYVLDVGFRDFDAARSAAVANALVAVYADERIVESADSKRRSTDWLKSRIDEARSSLAKAEREAARDRAAEAGSGGAAIDGSPAGGGRGVEDARHVYEALVARSNAAFSKQTLPVSAVSVLSDAVVPKSSSQPVLAVDALLGLLAGLAAAVGTAGWAAAGDRGFRRPAQVEDVLGLRTFGLVPSLPALAGWRRREGAERAVAAMRTTALATRASPGGDRPAVVGVVSAARGEGRSAVAAMLADVLVGEGRRVLLVDADGPALETSDVEVLVPGPDVLRLAAPSPAGGSDQGRLRAVLEGPGRVYDDVVIDLPPLGDPAGAAAVAGLVGSFVLVIGWATTDRALVAEALRSTPAVAARVRGAVLCRVDVAEATRSASDPRDAFVLSSGSPR